MSNIIIILILVYILTEYIRGKYENAFLIVLVSYVCMPVIKYGNDRGINSAYILTAVCLFIFLHSFINKKLIFDRMSFFFLISMSVGMIIRCIGLVINSRITKSSIISLIGLSQYIIAVFMMTVLIRSYSLAKKEFFRKVCIMIIILNYFIGILQISNLNIGRIITEQLYVYAGRDIPYNAIIHDAGRFVRMFGTFYTPTLLGITSLMLLSFFSFNIVGKDKVRFADWVCYIASLGLGLFALSKLVIIGAFIIWGLCFLCLIIQTKKGKKTLVLLGVTLATYLVIIGILLCMGLVNYVKYYFIENFNIITALETRYANIFVPPHVADEDSVQFIPSGDAENGSIENQNMEAGVIEAGVTGNGKGAIDIFLKHPFVGVGPVNLVDQFTGDSEYIGILHDGGILTFITYAVFYGTLIVFLFIRKRNSALLVLLSIGIGGISVPVFSSSCVIPFLVYVISDTNAALLASRGKK